MNGLLTLLARAVVTLIQALPLDLVARAGRACGGLAYVLDARHRRVARSNLSMCFPEKPAAEIRFLARENFRRIGENFACAAKTAAMSDAALAPHLRIIGEERLRLRDERGQPVRNVLFAVGHFANFELLARTGRSFPAYQPSTTYRALNHPALDAVMMKLRRQADCRFFERRTQSRELKESLERGGFALGLLADQNAGRRGVRIPFLGHDCYTSIAPSVLALRYDAPLHTCICYRIAPGRWEIEWGEEIPLRENGQPRQHEDIMRDVNRTFEAAVRRDPANWFWVHNRWRAEKPGRQRKTERNPPRDGGNEEGEED
jgi:KDO2-lipid IV(A) lauroyltransferase